MDNIRDNAHHIEHGGEYPLTNNRQPNQTNAQTVRKQNQQSMQGNTPMAEEFGSETDVEEVRQQNQQSQMKKQKAATQQPNQFGNGSR